MGFMKPEGYQPPPPPPPPAKRPEREEAITAQDVVLGGSDEDSTAPKGKRALLRPKGSAPAPTSMGGVGVNF